MYFNNNIHIPKIICITPKQNYISICVPFITWRFHNIHTTNRSGRNWRKAENLQKLIILQYSIWIHVEYDSYIYWKFENFYFYIYKSQMLFQEMLYNTHVSLYHNSIVTVLYILVIVGFIKCVDLSKLGVTMMSWIFFVKEFRCNHLIMWNKRSCQNANNIE